MPSFEKEVRQILAEYGCAFHRQGKGDHEIWFSPISKRLIARDVSFLGDMKQTLNLAHNPQRGTYPWNVTANILLADIGRVPFRESLYQLLR